MWECHNNSENLVSEILFLNISVMIATKLCKKRNEKENIEIILPFCCHFPIKIETKRKKNQFEYMHFHYYRLPSKLLHKYLWFYFSSINRFNDFLFYLLFGKCIVKKLFAIYLHIYLIIIKNWKECKHYFLIETT